MASFANPKITNAIASDVPEIQTLLGYLAKLRPDLGTNVPDGGVRLIQSSINAMWHFQVFKDGAWTQIDDFNLDAQTLRGYEPSTSAVAGKIPVYNASGQLVGNISGTAATATKLATPRSIQCGGIASSTAQNFDGSANITIPINQITVNNSADNALNGTVSIAHGGTGRTDGAAADVVVSGISGSFLAKSYGQIGVAKVLGTDADADSVLERGLYIWQGTAGVEQHLPLSLVVPCFMEVFNQGKYIEQILHTRSSNWFRYSSDRGASFGGWTPMGGIYKSITIYVSKSGSDLNTGLNNAYPVLTIDRALNVAYRLCGGYPDCHVIICLGAGNWDNSTVDQLPFEIEFAPYDAGYPTQYSTSLPVFNNLTVYGSTTVYLRGPIILQQLRCYGGCYVYIREGYGRFGLMIAQYNSTIRAESSSSKPSLFEFINYIVTGSIFISDGGTFIIGTNQTFKLAGNITANQFLYIGRKGKFIAGASIAIASSSYTFTGRKYYIASGGDISGLTDASLIAMINSFPGTTAGYFGVDGCINGRSYGAALDSQVVHKAGDTMTGDLTIAKATPCFIAKNTADANRDNTPSSQHVWYLGRAYDNINQSLGDHYVAHNNDGSISNTLRTYGQDGTAIYASLVRNGDNTSYFLFPTPAASSNTTHGATTAWVRALLASNSANEVPIGTICAYEGAFTRAIDAAVFFDKTIKDLSESLKNEEQAARMMRMSRAADEPTELGLELQELESKIFQLSYWKEFYSEMASRIPENDGVTLYNAEGNPISETIAYPEFEIQGRAFPNTKWNQYTGANGRFLIGADTTTYTYGGTGGSSSHTHSTSGSLGSTTLTTSNIPSHTHKTRDGGEADKYGSNNGRVIRSDYGFNTETNSAGSSGSHTHSLTLNTTGSAGTIPPYKVVYWIKKVA